MGTVTRHAAVTRRRGILILDEIFAVGRKLPAQVDKRRRQVFPHQAESAARAYCYESYLP